MLSIPVLFGLIAVVIWIMIAVGLALLIGGAVRERDEHAPKHGRRARR